MPVAIAPTPLPVPAVRAVAHPDARAAARRSAARSTAARPAAAMHGRRPEALLDRGPRRARPRHRPRARGHGHGARRSRRDHVRDAPGVGARRPGHRHRAAGDGADLPDASPAQQARFILQDSGARGLFVSDATQAEKILAVRHLLPRPRVHRRVHRRGAARGRARQSHRAAARGRHRARARAGQPMRPPWRATRPASTRSRPTTC